MTKMDRSPHLMPDPQTLRALIAEGPSPAATAALSGGQTPLNAEVVRVHFPATKPMQVMLRTEGDPGMLIGEWVGPAAAARARAESARLAKPRRGQTDGSPAPAVTADPCSGLVLRRPGFDAKLPGLRLLHDPAFAKSQLERSGLDPQSDIQLVSHRLGKRAVLRITGRTGTQYARLRPVTSGSGEAAYQRHLALWSALEGTKGLTIPRPLGFAVDWGIALFSALPGAPPVFRGVPGYRATRDVTRAIKVLQSLKLAADPHRATEELALLDTWADRTKAVFPELARQLRDPLARLAEDMASLPVLDPVPCHRDLHEGQVLLHKDGAGLLDFDTLRLGDPALDIGNLQAHLVLSGLQIGRTSQAFVTAMENSFPQLSAKRIAVWRRAALLRLAMIYAFSSMPPDVVLALVDGAA